MFGCSVLYHGDKHVKKESFKQNIVDLTFKSHIEQTGCKYHIDFGQKCQQHLFSLLFVLPLIIFYEIKYRAILLLAL